MTEWSHILQTTPWTSKLITCVARGIFTKVTEFCTGITDHHIQVTPLGSAVFNSSIGEDGQSCQKGDLAHREDGRIIIRTVEEAVRVHTALTPTELPCRKM